MTGRESRKALRASRTRLPPWPASLLVSDSGRPRTNGQNSSVFGRHGSSPTLLVLQSQCHFTGSEDPQQAEIQPHPSTDEETRRGADPTVRTGTLPVCLGRSDP
ncbi:hypothetical protein GHT09_017863 [Marmota monax]|uniref:Uncharacterized protein n=1 Tax=Marmota monax TaxID=9995 RepID=A0A834Q221_MARMO|nr:hypothetical protein GHT09_017863 [Marmota monax]